MTYTTTGPALDSCPFSPPPSKLSRQSATEIPLPMLPLADTEKLIREKDEEVSKHLSPPPSKARSPLCSSSLASPGPTTNLAPHSCAACKRCWRRCRPRCNRARFRASSQTLSEVPAGALLYLGSTFGLSLVQSQSPSPESRPLSWVLGRTGSPNPRVVAPPLVPPHPTLLHFLSSSFQSKLAAQSLTTPSRPLFPRAVSSIKIKFSPLN